MLTRSLLVPYDVNGACYDEVFAKTGVVRKHYQSLYDLFSDFTLNDFQRLNELVKLSFFNQGITFHVYGDKSRGIERIFPFDLFPRIIPSNEWEKLEEGIQQRNIALNLFIQDLYHEQKVLKDKIVPSELIFSSSHYCEIMKDINPVGGIYNHISGTDLIKHKDGEYYVLEDNIRCPSGVSYVLANRAAMKRNMASLFQKVDIAQVSTYPLELLAILQSLVPEGVYSPNVVVLTPGIYNSAYYEHSFLAQQMGVGLVEGRDLFVDNDYVYMKTINGPRRVDVIYRRIDDAFLDPEVFRKDSVLGVKGLMRAYRAGNVTLVNAPGTGVADDKAVYTYMPALIKYYLGEEAIIKNVHTYHCERVEDCQYVLENIDELVVKPVDESGGYGIVIGSQATTEEKNACKDRLKANPRKYIAQPIMSLSTLATYIDDSTEFRPRHIDLRVYTLQGKNQMYTQKGGLSRVALKEGSLIVNSSQGGGSKDTWVLEA